MRLPLVMVWHNLSSALQSKVSLTKCRTRAALMTSLILHVTCGLTSAQSQQSGAHADNSRHHQIHSVLASFEDRLHSPFSYALAKLDLGLEHLGRRLDNIDAKLSRIEHKLEQSEWTKEATSPLRRMEFPGYVDIQLDRISARLDVMEREIRELKYIPRSLDEKSTMSCRGCTRMSDASPIREMMSQVVTDNTFRLEDTMKWQMKEQTAATWDRLERSLAELEESIFNQINDTLNSLACTQKVENTETTSGTEETDVLFLVQKAITQSETKFRKLDSDVEKYTRKVMGSIRDLWTSSHQVKLSLEEALRIGNQTREVVRYEFLKLHQQIEPLPRLEPRLAEIKDTLQRNLGDLGATVDRSFASLLVAQNTFIDNCRRLHDEETHAYDVLQAVVNEMRNRSESDIGRIAADIRKHEDRIGRSFESVLQAIFAVGNSTADKIGKLSMSSKDCPQTTAPLIAGTELASNGRLRSSPQKTNQDYDQDYNVPENDYVDMS